MKKIWFLATILFLTGCAARQKTLYNWNNYSDSLYKLKKNPTEENIARHKDVLLKIIDSSTKKQMRIPPGVYCEYGYILLKEGKSDEALKYFDLEEQTYPESKVFITKLKAQVNKKKGKL